MAMYAKVRRMRLRDGLSISEIARRTSLSRNTIKAWLKEPVKTQMAYRREPGPRLIDPFAPWLARALETDAGKPRKQRRTALRLYEQIQAQGWEGRGTPRSSSSLLPEASAADRGRLALGGATLLLGLLLPLLLFEGALRLLAHREDR